MVDHDTELEKLRAAAEAAQAALAAAEKAAAEKAAAKQAAEKAGAEKGAAPVDGPLPPTDVDAIAAAYAFEGEVLEIGALVNGSVVQDAQVRIPLAMLNRHGLIAGATGTGKTRTLQGLAEQLAEKGVPVFAADIKGDLSGVAVPGEASEKLRARTAQIGQDWQPKASATEFFVLGEGEGIPLRATVSGFGPLLLSKVLGLNQTQESSLRLVFHYADENGLALVDLEDLRAVLTFLTSDAGKPELKGIGGISTATAGVILRELSAFAADGADAFFGEPEFDVTDLIRLADDGRGILNLLELPGVQNKPALFSTFLMYLLAELFEVLPEVGDLDKPKLVFFFDEAHLLFADASDDFLDSITQTVRLIRSKGIGVFFITQTPKDIAGDVLAQLGSRVQHALRAFTPNDAKALKATVSTYPTSGYDLERVLQDLGTGEAIVTVMSERGAPTPVAWTRVRAPQGLMSPAPATTITAAVNGSALRDKYAARVDPESAREILAAKMDAAHAAEARAADEKAAAAARKDEAAALKAKQKADREYEKMLREITRPPRTRTTTRRAPASPLDDLLGSSAQKLVSGVVRGLFGIGRR
ncbi:helicase HerA-like domain-containing protein [Microbacterium nanhaiense]|nr:helicase HerA-like domain-containing protein [Microbacterium nanhaiense]